MFRIVVCCSLLLLLPGIVWSKPAHLKSLADTLGKDFPAKLNNCQTCHLAGDDDDKPHNDFGKRITGWRAERRKAGLKNEIADALDAIGDEDADKDGFSNLIELLTGHLPGTSTDVPRDAEKPEGVKRVAAWRAKRQEYAWEPFQPVQRPTVPAIRNSAWGRNPIDSFIAEIHEKNGLQPRPEASKTILLRRLYFDLVGLPPTRAELQAFLDDTSPDAYEKVVDRLLSLPQYGEAQARQWMDVWRYSDWAGYGEEVRDSQPHIWRWRDWIVESLNEDKPYAQMVREMLAADEIKPGDEKALRATGFLVRNWYKFSREVWLDRAVEHTGKAFLGITMNCSRCHDHMYDPIPQVEYYAFRAIFSPHDIRQDRVETANGQKEFVVRVYDANPKAPTYLFNRGNDADPDKSQSIPPAIPAALRGRFEPKSISLPHTAIAPEDRPFLQREQSEQYRKQIQHAEASHTVMSIRDQMSNLMQRFVTPTGRSLSRSVTPEEFALAENEIALLRAKREVFEGHLRVEAIAAKESPEWKKQAEQLVLRQRQLAVAEANKKLLQAKMNLQRPMMPNTPNPMKLLQDAQAEYTKAEAQSKMPLTTAFVPRSVSKFPDISTGRRTALADWIVEPRNPLASRVAMNHLWLRRFGAAIVPTVFDFGKNGQSASHPKLLDWLAAEFVAQGWSLKKMHRLLVTSSTYRMDSQHDPAMANRDADNRYLWKANARRLSAESVRDAVLACSGELDRTFGGPELDQQTGMTSKRRSIYFRHAPEKQMQFLEIFDAASPAECYRRSESIVPQQALALANSPMTQSLSRSLARKLHAAHQDESSFLVAAFETILNRPATSAELDMCRKYLIDQEQLYGQKLTPTGGAPNPLAPSPDRRIRARESLILVLMNHNDFVTVR